MSDYIGKEALLEELNRYEKELYKDKRDAIDSDDEMMMLAIQNQETAITRIQKYAMYSIPTLSETEIIRKAFERVLERLEETKMRYFLSIANTGSEIMDFAYENVGDALDEAIEIVKEECGISE